MKDTFVCGNSTGLPGVEATLFFSEHSDRLRDVTEDFGAVHEDLMHRVLHCVPVIQRNENPRGFDAELFEFVRVELLSAINRVEDCRKSVE